jgi:hypothetical protein
MLDSSYVSSLNLNTDYPPPAGHSWTTYVAECFPAPFTLPIEYELVAEWGGSPPFCPRLCDDEEGPQNVCLYFALVDEDGDVLVIVYPTVLPDCGCIPPPPELYEFMVPLSTAEEIPPPAGAAGASGMARLALNRQTREVNLSGTYRNLSSPAVAAHVHGPAPRGATAAVLIPINHTGGTQGALSLQNARLSSAQVRAMLDGLTYINVHTQRNGAGEIRGQIEDGEVQKIPGLTASGVALLAAAFAVFGALAMRRRPAGLAT